MNCNRIRRLLPPFLDGEMAGRAQVAVAAHLASCPACRGELEALRADLTFLRSSAEPEAPAFLLTRVMAEARQAGLARRQTFSLGRVFAAVAAMLLVAVSVGAGVFLGNGLAKTGDSRNGDTAVSYVESSSADLYQFVYGGE
jgi:anti-sigma factor RsiW